MPTKSGLTDARHLLQDRASLGYIQCRGAIVRSQKEVLSVFMLSDPPLVAARSSATTPSATFRAVHWSAWRKRGAELRAFLASFEAVDTAHISPPPITPEIVRSPTKCVSRSQEHLLSVYDHATPHLLGLLPLLRPSSFKAVESLGRLLLHHSGLFGAQGFILFQSITQNQPFKFKPSTLVVVSFGLDSRR